MTTQLIFVVTQQSPRCELVEKVLVHGGRIQPFSKRQFACKAIVVVFKSAASRSKASAAQQNALVLLVAEKNSYFSFAVHYFDMEERNKEIQEIEDAYNSGKLAEFESTIGEIIDAKGAEILAFYENLFTKHKDATVSGALKIYILMHKSLNIKIENTAQVTEMEKEIWYLGEKLHRDPTQEEKQTTCREWCKKFASPYRIHLIEEYDFIIDKKSEEYENKLHAIAGQTRTAFPKHEPDVQSLNPPAP